MATHYIPKPYLEAKITIKLQLQCELIAHPHLLMQASSDWFLPARTTFRSVLARESHRLQPLLVLTVRWWPTLVSVGGLLLNNFKHVNFTFTFRPTNLQRCYSSWCMHWPGYRFIIASTFWRAQITKLRYDAPVCVERDCMFVLEMVPWI